MKENEKERNIRYASKITYIIECLDEIEESLPNPSGIILKGIFYDLSTAIESSMDMIAMLCKDLGIMPKGDYENIQSLNDREIFDDELSQSLAKSNGLRNFLVHQYNGVKVNIVLDSIPNVKNALLRFIKIMEEHLGER